MNKTITGIVGGTALVAGVLTGLTTAAEAAPKATVTVTIKAEGVELSGVVKSSNPALCAADRKVKVFKMINGQPHLFSTDTTGLQGTKWTWNTGNTGQEGRFFAKVSAKPGCKADVSPTITAVRND
jgi:hypothetical protein